MTDATPPPTTAEPTPAPIRRQAGRPMKYFMPPEGEPISPELKRILQIREYNKKQYEKDHDAVLASKRRCYHERRAKYLENMKKLGDLQVALAASKIES